MPPIEPRPPTRIAPPMTTAEIESQSKPVPASGSPEPVRVATAIPASAAKKPQSA